VVTPASLQFWRGQLRGPHPIEFLESEGIRVPALSAYATDPGVSLVRAIYVTPRSFTPEAEHYGASAPLDLVGVTP
jgi:hypothetical protein